ncbi:hypothetical protein CDAR_260091 [Caerostris darwini]|uniref:Uncharacterized protein n=1 Tax=Caerostris darwini TaxID=1538125 RepID=A0AAV4V9Y8_9ARAC|nr:hypothetical protein CDAR_260091 [Caerostris darwini]
MRRENTTYLSPTESPRPVTLPSGRPPHPLFHLTDTHFWKCSRKTVYELLLNAQKWECIMESDIVGFVTKRFCSHLILLRQKPPGKCRVSGPRGLDSKPLFLKGHNILDNILKLDKQNYFDERYCIQSVS